MTRWIGITAQGQAIRDTVTDHIPEQAGITFIEVDYTDVINITTQYFDNGVFVEKGFGAPFFEFDYGLKQWTASPVAAWAGAKQKRARALAESDWVVTKATERGQPVPGAWAAYRQALRDVTQQSDPFNIVWPVAPT